VECARFSRKIAKWIALTSISPFASRTTQCAAASSKRFARDIDIGEVATAAFSVDFFYEEGEAGKFVPVARDLEVRNLKTRKAQYALYLRGFDRAPIDGVRVVDCEFNGVSKPDVVENVTGLALHNVKENGRLIERAQTAKQFGAPS